MNSNPTPKERYQSIPTNVSDHRKLTELTPFDRAVDFAYLEYSRHCNSVTQQNPNLAAASAFKLSGAWEFIAELKKLSEKITMPTIAPIPNLDHKA